MLLPNDWSGPICAVELADPKGETCWILKNGHDVAIGLHGFWDDHARSQLFRFTDHGINLAYFDEKFHHTSVGSGRRPTPPSIDLSSLLLNSR